MFPPQVFPYGTAMTKKPSFLLIAAAAFMMTGCPGDDGGTSSGGSLASSGNVVYLADQNTDGVFELFLTSSGVKLNGPLASGASGVVSFALTPDKSAVVYIADEKTVGVFELFQVNIATPGVSVKLNGTLLIPQADVESFVITPDGTSVVYSADPQFDQVFEVFRVLFATPQASTRLNPPLALGQTVTKFSVTPDSTRAVYVANQDPLNLSVDELYQVAFLNPQNPTKLNVALPAGRNVTDFSITPNGGSVVYLADKNFLNVFEIFLSPMTGPGSVNSLNPPLSTPKTVTAFAATPDSTAVIYRADETTPGTFELYRVAFGSPQTSVKLNGTLTPGGNVSTFSIAPNGSSVVYSADQIIFGVVELFRVALSQPTPGPAQKINPNYTAPQSVSAFAIAPDSGAAVYLANQAPTNVLQLYRVPFSCLQANPPSSCPQAIPPPTSLPPLNGPLAGNVSSFAVSPDSTLVFYLADQTTFGVTELYAVNVGSPGSSSKLNGQLVTGGNVTAFTF